MALLRSICLALLVLAVLPWGAFAAAQDKGAAMRQALHSARQADVTLPQVVAEVPLRIAAIVHRCRTATVPGSFCHPVMVAPPVSVVVPPQGGHPHGWTLAGGWRTGVIPPVQKKPPRQI